MLPLLPFPLLPLLFLPLPAVPQAVSISMPVPPLQWLNITNLIQGSPASPLKYSSIGYDDNSRTLIIFGGESSSGIPTSQTFLINLDTLSWSFPNPEPDLPSTSPPARSMALSGDDFSSSYRRAHLVAGGQGSNAQPLSDVWEYDYINQFWSQVDISGVPPPRWSASGGRDYRTPYNNNSSNTTFYMSGGTNGSSMFPLNEVWQLQITGILSSNLATNDTSGSWSSLNVGTVPGSSVSQASTVLGSSIVSVSGCNSTTDSSDTCADSNTFIVNVGSPPSEITPPPCPAPRYGGSLVFNPSTASLSSFPHQVFLILGTFNSSYWDDQGGLQLGEVAVLDTSTGTWSRVLPAGDPGTSGVPSYPTPRQGAVAYSFSEALVGSNRQAVADTIVFGGQDENGIYLNEVWILRAYNGVIKASNSSWGGPSGQLETGVNASGAGVTVEYMNQCASQLQIIPTATSSTGAPTATSTSTAYPYKLYDVSFVHKLASPLSVALILPAILLTRLALPSAKVAPSVDRNVPLVYSASVIAISAYGLGFAGLVTSFTSIRSTMAVTKRGVSSPFLKTGHGISGLILVAVLYVVVPLLYILSFFRPARRRSQKEVERSEVAASRANSVDTAEKLASSSAAQQTQYPPSPPASPRTRLHSWGGSSFWLGRRSREGRVSTDSESMHSAGPQRAFEVVNRPTRIRRASINGLAYPNIEIYQRVPVVPRSLGDVDWLDRRRSLNAVNELDFIVNHGRTQGLSNGSTPNTTDMLSTRALMPTPAFPPMTHELPPPLELSLRVCFHMLVLALCVLSLVALRYRAPVSLFAAFLLWIVIFYISLFVLAWYGRPSKSLLTTLAARIRGSFSQPAASPGTPTSRPLSTTGTDQFPFPTDTRGPYIHQPTYRVAGHDDVSTSQDPRSVETDDDEDDIDEDTRQRRIEEEMGRREVSIVTVPKRRLWITNPS